MSVAENMEIGNVLKAYRESSGFSQEVVASFLGIKREVLSYYESNSRQASLDVLEKLADLYGVELVDFFEKNENMTKADVAFRADDITGSDLEVLANFKKIVKNYLKMIELEKKDE